MKTIIMADHGIEFDGTTIEQRPLGGAESSFIHLAEAFARRGFDVTCYTCCKEPIDHKGVKWRPLEIESLPEEADMYIANRSDKLILKVPHAKNTVFWLHNPAGYVVKWRYLWKLFKRRPVLHFIGKYHAKSCPSWVPDGGRMTVPYGVNPEFVAAEPNSTIPAPKAMFTSNPLRSLDWVLHVWGEHIHPNVPEAELHVFSGKATYGAAGDRKAMKMDNVLNVARAMSSKGVVLHEPVPKSELLEEMKTARALLYRGDVGETYCLAVGEAQTLGVPAVVQAIGSTGERVVHGETGYIAENQKDFGEKAVDILSDDLLWRRMHDAALEIQRKWTWDRVVDTYTRQFPTLQKSAKNSAKSK